MALIKRRGQALLPDRFQALAYTLSGPEAAPLVVFVNGLGGAQAAFTLQVRDFCKTHASSPLITAAWTVGCGGRAGSHGRHAADEGTNTDEIGAGQVDLVGLSFGGRVVMRAAAGWPGAFDAWSWGNERR